MARLILMSVFLVPMMLVVLTVRMRDARRALRLTLLLTVLYNLVYVLLVSYYFPKIAP